MIMIMIMMMVLMMMRIKMYLRLCRSSSSGICSRLQSLRNNFKPPKSHRRHHHHYYHRRHHRHRHHHHCHNCHHHHRCHNRHHDHHHVEMIISLIWASRVSVVISNLLNMQRFSASSLCIQHFNEAKMQRFIFHLFLRIEIFSCKAKLSSCTLFSLSLSFKEKNFPVPNK